MKKHLQSCTLLVTAYLLALPFLYAVHAYHHDPIEELIYSHDIVIVKKVVHCELCEAYLNQRLENFIPQLTVKAFVRHFVHFFAPPQAAVNLTRQIYLQRGPPQA